MATKADLRNRVLRHLRVLPDGETASATDTVKVEEAIDEIHEQLVGEGLAKWELSDIPDEVMRPLVKWVAYEVADEFGVPEGRVQRLLVQSQRAANQIRRQVLPDDNGEPITAEYF